MKEELAEDTEESFVRNGTSLAIEKLITYFKRLVIDPLISYYCVATILNPRLRMLWFKDKWAEHEIWHKKAEKSMKDVFLRYLEQQSQSEEVEMEFPEHPRRRKVPGGTYHDDAFEETMGVNLHLQTGKDKVLPCTRYFICSYFVKSSLISYYFLRKQEPQTHKVYDRTPDLLR